MAKGREEPAARLRAFSRCPCSGWEGFGSMLGAGFDCSVLGAKALRYLSLQGSPVYVDWSGPRKVRRLSRHSYGGSCFTSSRDSKEKMSKSLRRCPTIRQEVRLSTWFRLVRFDVLNWWFKFYISHQDGSPLTAPFTMLAKWVPSCTTNRRLFLHGRHVTKDILVVGKRVDLVV